MDRKVVLTKPVRSRSQFGDVSVVYVDVATVYALVKPVGYPRSDDTAERGRLRWQSMRRMDIRHRTDVDVTWRVNYENHDWDVVDVMEIGRKAALRLIVQRGVQVGVA